MAVDCLKLLKDSLKGNFELESINSILDQLKNSVTEAADKASSIQDALNAKGEEIRQGIQDNEVEKEFMFWKKIEKQNVATELVANFMKANKKAPLWRAMKSYIDGTQFNLPGTRYSYELNQHILNSLLNEGFKTNLANDGVLSFWNAKENEMEIIRGIRTGDSSIPEANIIGKHVRDNLDKIKALEQKEGLFTGTLDERLTRNFHTPELMMRTSDNFNERLSDSLKTTPQERFEKASNRWSDFILPKLNLKKTFGRFASDEDSQRKILRTMFTTLTNGGDYLKDPEKITISARRGRRIFWKDDQSMFEYNKEYGKGTIHSALDAEFRNSARRISSLEFFGDSRNQFMRDTIKSIENKFPELKNRFNKEKEFKKIKRLLDTASGSLYDPASKWTKAAGNIQSGLAIADLGNVVIASTPDLAATAIELRPIMGGFFDGAGKSLRVLTDGLSAAGKKEFGDMLKTATMHDVGNNTRWFTSEGAPSGLLAKGARLSFKLNGLYYWDKGIRSGVMVLHARHLALNADKSFENMLERDKIFGETNVNTLRSYGLTGNDWDAVRKVPIKMVDGKGYIMPESADDIPDQVIKRILQKEGSKSITPSRIEERRSMIRRRLNSYFVDRSDHAILRPSAQDKDMWFRGTNSGTAFGFLARSMSTFRLYATTFINKPLSRLIYGTTPQTFFNKMLGGKADYAGLVQLATYGALLGFLSKYATNLAKGISPPSLKDPKTYTDALIDGGFFGIYSSLLTSSTSFGSTPFDLLGGPVISELNDIGKVAINVKNGKLKAAGHQAFRIFKGNFPLHNAPFVRYPLDYFFMNRMQEAISPGYFERRQRELEKHGQTYILPPLPR